MVTPLDWHAATFPPDGGLSGEGAVKVLGKPEKLDPLAVLVHEMVQNSWDSAVDRFAIPVEYSVRGWSVTEKQRRVLRESIFRTLPPSGLPLRDVLAEDEILALCIGDIGTVGLGGPVRMDTAAPLGQPTDYVDFVFAVGAPQDRDASGGTYGFGKTIAYLLSRARTIVIYTRTAIGSGHESRLIAAAIGSQFTKDGMRHTGRHWWGRASPEDSVIEPIRGEEADRLADQLGIGSFPGSETGTRIMVIQPELGLRTPQESMRYMAQSALWYAWPLLLDSDGGPAPLSCLFSWEGETVELANPREHPHLSLYVRALEAVREEQGEHGPTGASSTVDVREVECLRPRQTVGHLGIALGAYRPMPTVDEGQDDEGRPASAVPYPDRSHHVALMRGVELVVDYVDGPRIEDGAWHWAAVFRALPEVDDAFAEAEPPTHDAWNPSMVMDRTRRRFVNVGLRRIREIVHERFASPRASSSQSTWSAAEIADRLAHLLLGIPGPRPTSPTITGGGGGSRPNRPTISMGERRLRLEDDGRIVREFDFAINRVRDDRVWVTADVGVLVAGGGRESDPPAASEEVEAIGFRRTGAPGRPRQGTEVRLSVDDGDEWTFLVEGPSDVGVVVDLRVTEDES